MHNAGQLCLVLCQPEQQDLYHSHFDELAEERSFVFDFVDGPEDFTQYCLSRSPMVGLADVGSIIRGDTEKLNRIFQYRVRWPVVRCQISPSGKGQVMRMKPPLRGDTQESLRELCQGGSTWELAAETRHHLRAKVMCRARIGVEGGEPDRQVNLQTLSQAGCLILSDAPPDVGARVALEIRDLPGANVQLEAEVAWNSKWEDSPQTPRAGLRFTGAALPQAISTALADPDFVGELC